MMKEHNRGINAPSNIFNYRRIYEGQTDMSMYNQIRTRKPLEKDILKIMKSEVKKQNKPLDQIDFEAGFTDGYFSKLLNGRRSFSLSSIYC
ncbi:hypothetical protein [Roseivirga pacifica]|uniref:hypothetical protein n=1 Tax=Roseivirga pacifica TaxID=1267423 RepID=UPI00227B0FC3|nr:hypothetical protein [Roseivirga pacifica]